MDTTTTKPRRLILFTPDTRGEEASSLRDVMDWFNPDLGVISFVSILNTKYHPALLVSYGLYSEKTTVLVIDAQGFVLKKVENVDEMDRLFFYDLIKIISDLREEELYGE